MKNEKMVLDFGMHRGLRRGDGWGKCLNCSFQVSYFYSLHFWVNEFGQHFQIHQDLQYWLFMALTDVSKIFYHSALLVLAKEEYFGYMHHQKTYFTLRSCLYLVCNNILVKDGGIVADFFSFSVALLITFGRLGGPQENIERKYGKIQGQEIFIKAGQIVFL